VASFVIALVAGTLVFFSIAIAALLRIKNRPIPKNDPADGLIGLVIIGSSVLSLIGLVLTIVGVCQPNRRFIRHSRHGSQRLYHFGSLRCCGPGPCQGRPLTWAVPVVSRPLSKDLEPIVTEVWEGRPHEAAEQDALAWPVFNRQQVIE
jgi:hypothetical protein